MTEHQTRFYNEQQAAERFWEKYTRQFQEVMGIRTALDSAGILSENLVGPSTSRLMRYTARHVPGSENLVTTGRTIHSGGMIVYQHPPLSTEQIIKINDGHVELAYSGLPLQPVTDPDTILIAEDEIWGVQYRYLPTEAGLENFM